MKREKAKNCFGALSFSGFDWISNTRMANSGRVEYNLLNLLLVVCITKNDKELQNV